MVRRMASRGVDRIKVMATERAGTPDTDPRVRVFNDEELAAIVDESNKAGLWVVAHAHGNEGAAAAVRAGVHSIEHGTYLSDDTLRLMKRKASTSIPRSPRLSICPIPKASTITPSCKCAARPCCLRAAKWRRERGRWA